MTDEGMTGDEPVARTEIPPNMEPSEAVISTIATFEDLPPTELEVFHEVVDPDALNNLIQSGSEGVAVTMQYAGYVVTVRGEGTLILREN